MNKKYGAWLRAGLLLLLCTTGVLARGQTEPAKPAASKIRMAEEAYKNVQSLKGIPADQLIPSMQFITYSLGVECSFCHVEGAFEKDDKKPKQIARKMIQMMFTINHENFEGKREVTCYSCHRGSSRPLATPIIAEAVAQSAAENVLDDHGAAPANAPTAEQIFTKYVDALGGASAIGKLSTRVEKGTISLGGRQLPIDIFSKTPGKRMTIIHLPNGDNITTYDGTSGWTSAPGRPVRDIPASEAISARLEGDLQLPVRSKELAGDLKTAKPEKIGDRDVYVVSGFNAGEPIVKFYFDESSGLLLRILRYVDSPLGRNPTQIDYSDYRNEGNVKMPFQRTIARPGTRFTIQIEEARNNVAVDGTKFARPATEPEHPKPPSP
jgi:photosynthetic reaction center cytochrome c subunit